MRYYMLDFLSIVEHAKLYDTTVTPVQAARTMLGVIREAAGKDTHIQTAVASTPSYAGIIDAARVGRDFGEGRALQGGPPLSDWRNATHVLHDLHYSNTLFFLQNVAANYFTHRKLYMNDFNLLTIDKPMPLEHARIAVTIFGLGGSPLMLGDDYTQIDPDRLRMAKLCLPRTREVARPLDLFEHVYPDDYCRILTLRVQKPWGNYSLAAVFNMDETSYEFKLDFARLGLEEGAHCRIYEFWTEEYCGTFAGTFFGVIPPNACRLYRVEQARRHPWLLSTDMHLQQGAAEVEELEWDETRMRLSCTVCRPCGERGSLFFLMPRKYRAIGGKGLGLLKEIKDLNVIVRLPVEFKRERMDFELFFEPWELPYVTPKHFFPYSTEREWLDYVEDNRKPGDTRVYE